MKPIAILHILLLHGTSLGVPASMAQPTHALETPPLLYTRLGNQNHNSKFITLLCVVNYKNWCALLK